MQRRFFLGLAGAAAALPAVALARGPSDADLRRVLDALGAIDAPAAKLAALARFGAGLSPSASLDLDTVRAALAIDVRLAAQPATMQSFALRVERGTGATGDGMALHRRFVAEAAALTREADAALRQLGRRDGPVASRIVAAFRDAGGLYPDDDAGRDAAVADMNRSLAAAVRRLPELFGPIPPECRDVAARRMTPADEAARKGGFRVLPSPDHAGGYFVDLADIARRPRWTLASVVHHELLPGHLLQLPIEAQADPHPLRVAVLAAFQEGWGVYAERLMARHGAYDGDPAGRLGHLHWILFRLGRGLIDTGIHLLGWTKDEARARLVALHGEPAYFASFEQDIDRVARDPGVRAAETVVWLGLANLSRRANNPGALRHFHRAALIDGRIGLDALAARVRT